MKKCNFENCDITNINQEALKSIENYTELCIKNEMRNGIIIYGNIGYEKTHLAAGIANKMIEESKIVLMEKTSSITDKIKQSFNESAISETQIIDLYSNIDILIIDDLGSESLSKWALEKLYKIINNRYENELPIVITTRYNKYELVEQLANENDIEIAKEIVEVLYRMCYGVTLIKNKFDEMKKLA